MKCIHYFSKRLLCLSLAIFTICCTAIVGSFKTKAEGVISLNTETDLVSSEAYIFRSKESGYYTIRLNECEKATVTLTDEDGNPVGTLKAKSNLIYRYLCGGQNYNINVLSCTQPCTITISKASEQQRPTFEKELSLSVGETIDFSLVHNGEGSFWDTETTAVITDDSEIAECLKTVSAGSVRNGKVKFVSYITVHGKKAGATKLKFITATGKEYSFPLTVTNAKDAEPADIILNSSSIELYNGESYTLSATVIPENAVNKSITFISEDQNIATVDEFGKITAVGDGITIIRCTASNGIEAECTVTVKSTPKLIVNDNIQYLRRGDRIIIANTTEVGNLFLNDSSELFFDKTDNAKNKICNGTTVTLKIKDTAYDRLTFILLGDIDCDGSISVKDARLALRQAVSLESLSPVSTASAVLSDTSEIVTVSDARRILRAAVGLENPSDWLKALR